jgi:hypothetical protein
MSLSYTNSSAATSILDSAIPAVEFISKCLAAVNALIPLEPSPSTDEFTRACSVDTELNPTGYSTTRYSHLDAKELETPNSYSDAMHSSESKFWKEAIASEAKSLVDQHVMIIHDKLPKGKNPVKSRWVFKLKREDGKIVRFKARLVAKGYAQVEGIDFDQTFAPVVRRQTIYAALHLAALRDHEIEIADIKTAYLIPKIAHEVWLKLPAGVQGRYAKLEKGLYGLKQASCLFYLHMHAYMVKRGYTRSLNDPCLYYIDREDERSFVLVYVDDLIMISPSKFSMKTFVDQLMADFNITIQDSKKPRTILGLKLVRDRTQRLIHLSQELYIRQKLEQYGLDKCKPTLTQLLKKKLAETILIMISENSNLCLDR